jgi:hypothetical protein
VFDVSGGHVCAPSQCVVERPAGWLL